MVKKIVLYSTPICPKCHVLKRVLPSDTIVADMSDPTSLTELRINGVFTLSAPVLQVGDNFYVESDLFKNENVDMKNLQRILEA